MFCGGIAKNLSKSKKKTGAAGFTLIELAITVTIIGVLIGYFFQALNIFVIKKRQTDLDNTLMEVRSALSEYIDANDRYPCPASLTDGLSNANFGKERTAALPSPPAPAGAIGCTDVAGVILDPRGAGPDDDVYIGAVPVRTLGLASRYALDPYNNRLTYAVSAVLSDTDGMLNPPVQGAVVLNDAGGNQILGDLPFALISHGQDGAGSYTAAGALNGTACPADPAAERENCDGDAAFVELERAIAEDMTTYYDDFAAFSLTDDNPDGWWKATDPSGTDITNKNTGNVGIGTDAPQFTLHINDKDTAAIALQADDPIQNVWPPANPPFAEDYNNSPGLFFLNNTGTEIASVGIAGAPQARTGTASPNDFVLRSYARGQADGGDMIFATSPTDDMELSPKMTIKENGNVGIGTANPQVKLDVQGEVKVGNTGAACNASRRGAVRFNPAQNRMEFCGNAGWAPMGGSGVPAGTIAMFNSACPAGWALFGPLANRFPQGSNNGAGVGGAGGSIFKNTFGGFSPCSHTLRPGGTCISYSISDVRPPFYVVNFCVKL